MLGYIKVADIKDSLAIGKITKVVTTEVKEVIKGVIIVAEIIDHVGKIVAEIVMFIETDMTKCKLPIFSKQTFASTPTGSNG